MNDMIFKHYCAVFFNPGDGLNEEVSKISEDAPRAMKGKGISIYTFTSVVDVPVLSEYFKSFNRNFLLFDLNESNSGFNFLDKTKEDDLFGFLNISKPNKDFEELSNRLMDDILKDMLEAKGNSIINIDIPNKPTNNFFNIESYHSVDAENELSELTLNMDFDNISKNEIHKMMNEIIDKGINNLTDFDKKMLDKLSNL